MSPDQVHKIEAKWGLNEPLYIQYLKYMANLLTGDAGQSFEYSKPVWEVVKDKILHSLVLVGPGITAAYLIGSLFGGLMGRYRGSRFEKYGILVASFLGTVPAFVTGIFLLVVFSFWIPIFPVGGMQSIESSIQNRSLFELMLTRGFWWHYTLPFITVVARYVYVPSMVMRNSVVEVSNQNFIFYHRVKGLSRLRQLRHQMKHASLPVMTLYPVTMTRAFAGLVLVETVFNWPGIGNALVQAVLIRDYPVVQFVFVIAAIWVILGNYVIDVLYSIVDPRVSIDGTDST